MIESLRNTKLYKSLNLNKNMHHAYLFHSVDKQLNNNVALLFAKSILCENNSGCGNCSACKQFDSNSHPDFIKLDQSSIKVDDVNNLMAKMNTKPLSSTYKVFVILNAENINEISQNKLLKSLEEPNSSSLFILTTSKLDKLLPTVLSRLHKINVPKISFEDLSLIYGELKQTNIDVEKYLTSNMNLTEILNFVTDKNYQNTLSAIKYIFENLKSSQDIPKVASNLPDLDKSLFFLILQKVFLSCINNENLFVDLNDLINSTYPKQALINSLSLIDDAYKKQMSNVNFSYILDNLLFNILKEKFLCKQ